MSSDEHWYTLTLPYIANLIEGTVFDSLFVIVFTIFLIPFACSLSFSISWSFVMCFRHMHFACLIWKRFSEQVSLRHIHWPLNKHNYHSFAIILLRLHYTTHIDFDFLFLAILPAQPNWHWLIQSDSIANAHMHVHICKVLRFKQTLVARTNDYHHQYLYQ